MRLATYKQGSRTSAGVISGDTVVPFGQLGNFPNTMLGLIEAGPSAWDALRKAADSAPAGVPLSEVTLLAPVPRPPKNPMCLGLNYAAHADEQKDMRADIKAPDQFAIVFTKSPTSIIGSGAPIPLDPAVSSELDWEVELGVIIGVGGSRIGRGNALRHVFGYTVINDVSARDIQMRHKQFFLGKSLTGGCPMGPWLVTADEIADPQSLRLRTLVNGETKQDANTSDMIFSVAHAIEVISHSVMLEAGDVIATGTPDGVGFARKPAEFLKAGDTVTCEIEGIGTLENPVVAA